MGAQYINGKFVSVEADPDFGKKSDKFNTRKFDEVGNHIPAQAGDKQNLRDEKFDTRQHGPTDPASVSIESSPNIPEQAGARGSRRHPHPC